MHAEIIVPAGNGPIDTTPGADREVRFFFEPNIAKRQAGTDP